MDKTTTSLAVRIGTALEVLGITAKRTAVYDLIAAARGLRNRELLKRPYAMPDAADTTKLAPIAARIDGRRIDEICSCVSALALPTLLTCAASSAAWARGLSTHEFQITAEELEKPDEFLSGPRGDAALAVLSRNMYHTSYYRDRSDRGLDLATANDLAEDMLTSAEPLEAIENHYGHGRSASESVEEQSSEIDRAIDSLRDLGESVGIEIDEDEWRSALEDEIADKLADDDDTSVEDMLDDQDRAELVFLLSPPGYSSDGMITRADYGFENLSMDRSLQFALSRIGYTLGEYRRFAGSDRETCDDILEDLRPLPRVLASPGDLREIVDNETGQYFHLCLYVQVPVKQLIAIDLARPIVIRGAWLATYDPHQGSFSYGRDKIDEIVVRPEDGHLRSCGGGWKSPSKICDFVDSYYHGDVENVPEDVEGTVVQMEKCDQRELPLAA